MPVSDTRDSSTLYFRFSRSTSARTFSTCSCFHHSASAHERGCRTISAAGRRPVRERPRRFATGGWRRAARRRRAASRGGASDARACSRPGLRRRCRGDCHPPTTAARRARNVRPRTQRPALRRDRTSSNAGLAATIRGTRLAASPGESASQKARIASSSGDARRCGTHQQACDRHEKHDASEECAHDGISYVYVAGGRPRQPGGRLPHRPPPQPKPFPRSDRSMPAAASPTSSKTVSAAPPTRPAIATSRPGR